MCNPAILVPGHPGSGVGHVSLSGTSVKWHPESRVSPLARVPDAALFQADPQMPLAIDACQSLEPSMASAVVLAGAAF